MCPKFAARIHPMRALLLMALANPLVVGAQDYYYYGKKKILLVPNLKAAIVQELTPGIVNKFNALSEYSRDLGGGRYYAAIKGTRAAIVGKLASRNLVETYPTYSYGDQQAAVTGDIIVTFKSGVAPLAARRLMKAFGSAIVTRNTEPNSYKLHIVNPKSTITVANMLDRNRNVLYAQPDFLHIVTNLRASARPKNMAALAAPSFPSDTYFAQQWGLENKNTNPVNGKLGADIKVRAAWNVTHGSSNVVVAIIDEGVDATNPDLQGKVIKVFDTFPDGSGAPEAGDNHGTNCAGVVAAIVDNGIGIAGVAPNTNLISIRVIRTKDGIQESSSDTVANGIKMAVDNGAHIISMSLVMNMPETAIQSQIDRAVVSGARGSKGTVMVFPSGDSGAAVSFPANLSLSRPVIAVGASNEFDQVKTRDSSDHDAVSWASNVGKELTLVAPGVHVCTTDLATPNEVPYVCDFRGTSAAVPFVAGVAALLISQNPNLTASQVRNQLTTTADKLGTPMFDPSYGFGRINACRALGGVNC